MEVSSIPAVWRDARCFQWSRTSGIVRRKRSLFQVTTSILGCRKVVESRLNSPRLTLLPTNCPWWSNSSNSFCENGLGRPLHRSRVFSLPCHASKVAVAVNPCGRRCKNEDLLGMHGEEQMSEECSLRREETSFSISSNTDLAMDLPHSGENSGAGGQVAESEGSSIFEPEVPASQGRSGIFTEGQNMNSSIADEQTLVIRPVVESSSSSLAGRNVSKYERELEVAVKAVQLSCVLSQRIQQRVLRNEENSDFKKDRTLVTVADWGVQAVVSWVLAQAFQGEEIPMIAEEDTTELRGMDKIGLLQRVVAAVNECLQYAGIVGVSPPVHPLGTIDVLKAINKGSAVGGRKGRYWVLDPVDGTLGFVRGDQYAIALALIEDGEVVLAVLGCPNYPLRKQWLVHHHRYYRIASRMYPPNPSQWHKGLILATTKGAGKVTMQPLVMDSDGSRELDVTKQMAKSVHVSSIDDPAEATFCEPFEKANSNHSFTAGLAQQLGLRNRPLRVYSMAKYAAIARGDAEIFMKFAKAGYREKIWDHAAGVLIVQEAGGVVTDGGGRLLDFSQGRCLDNLDRGIIACSGITLHEKLLKAADASWNSSRL